MKGYTNYDASLIYSVCPSGAAGTTEYTSAIDLGPTSNEGVRSETFELEVQIPSFTKSELPADAALSVKLYCSETEDFSSAQDVLSVEVGNAVANDAKTVRYKPTLDGARFWRVGVTTTLASGASVAETALAKKIALAYVC